MQTARYILIRLLYGLALVLAVVVLNFFLIRLAPLRLFRGGRSRLQSVKTSSETR